MYLLGTYLADGQLVRMALTRFYGIGHETAKRLCARLQLHDRARIKQLSEAQLAALSAYISSPSSIPKRTAEPTFPYPTITAPPPKDNKSIAFQAPTGDATLPPPPPSQRSSSADDPLRSLVLEAELRREVRGNIAHHRSIGSYVGRRHAAGLPVRGQRTQSNAITARKLNKLERRGFATWATDSKQSVSEMVEQMRETKHFGSDPRPAC